MKTERLSKKELYDIAKQSWDGDFPSFEKFKEGGLGIQADDDTNLWMIDHSGNYISIEVFKWETKEKVSSKLLVCKDEQWVDTGWDW